MNKKNLIIELKALGYLIGGIGTIILFFKLLETLSHYPNLFIGCIVGLCLILGHRAIV